MVNVQCEQCHGPGGLHAQDPENVSARLSGEQTCLSCHTKDTDPGFSYQKKQKTGIH
jgi:mono/diheme cytochrome c family protein